MTNYFDELETQDPRTRQQSLINAVAAQVAHAKAEAPAYGRILADIDPADITSTEAISRLPLTRKSALIELQQSSRPFGGMAAVKSPQLAYVFASPGPIYEPGSKRQDFWRFARALFAAGFRTEERFTTVSPTISYRPVPCSTAVHTPWAAQSSLPVLARLTFRCRPSPISDRTATWAPPLSSRSFWKKQMRRARMSAV